MQPLTLEGEARGVALLAIDAVGAGVGERVLVVIEGKAAGDALRRKGAAVDAAIIGIVDSVDVSESERKKPRRRASAGRRRGRARRKRRLSEDAGMVASDRSARLVSSRSRRWRLASHASHFRYALPGSGEACLIEPTVQCNHCGYCQSHGH